MGCSSSKQPSGKQRRKSKGAASPTKRKSTSTSRKERRAEERAEERAEAEAASWADAQRCARQASRVNSEEKVQQRDCVGLTAFDFPRSDTNTAKVSESNRSANSTPRRGSAGTRAYDHVQCAGVRRLTLRNLAIAEANGSDDAGESLHGETATASLRSQVHQPSVANPFEA
jgi:hypothetical protein